MKPVFLLLPVLLWSCCAMAQSASLRWLNPLRAPEPAIQGRLWQDRLEAPFYRLPERAKATVRKAVWDLSHNTAGLYICFTSNATSVTVRYQVSERLSMNHMPATGVSGVDLYAKDIDGNWHWAKGRFRFGDTIQYEFSNMVARRPIREFRLYLPLYNTVRWLEVGVAQDKQIAFMPLSKQKPVVFYGTSIMQGACASRPGLAWTNIVGRRISLPVVNLGFSGNGRLEPALIDRIKEQDASLFVLDCQPNLHDRNTYSESEIGKRIRAAVRSLRTTHPVTPILLVEHSCGRDGINMDTAMVTKFKWTSAILRRTYAALKREGQAGLYLLSAAEIGFDLESTVDGTHPNDIGMMHYADAYTRKIKEIIGRP